MTHDKYAYRIIWSDEDEEYVGLCAEFPSLSWLSSTPDAAFKGIRKLVADTLKDMKKEDEEIPEPIALQKFSGKFIVRVPPHVHRDLFLKALEAKVSLNRYISAKLAGEKRDAR